MVDPTNSSRSPDGTKEWLGSTIEDSACFLDTVVGPDACNQPPCVIALYIQSVMCFLTVLTLRWVTTVSCSHLPPLPAPARPYPPRPAPFHPQHPSLAPSTPYTDPHPLIRHEMPEGRSKTTCLANRICPYTRFRLATTPLPPLPALTRPGPPTPALTRPTHPASPRQWHQGQVITSAQRLKNEISRHYNADKQGYQHNMVSSCTQQPLPPSPALTRSGPPAPALIHPD